MKQENTVEVLGQQVAGAVDNDNECGDNLRISGGNGGEANLRGTGLKRHSASGSGAKRAPLCAGGLQSISDDVAQQRMHSTQDNL
jgi:hypothetical protein